MSAVTNELQARVRVKRLHLDNLYRAHATFGHTAGSVDAASLSFLIKERDACEASVVAHIRVLEEEIDHLETLLLTTGGVL